MSDPGHEQTADAFRATFNRRINAAAHKHDIARVQQLLAEDSKLVQQLRDCGDDIPAIDAPDDLTSLSYTELRESIAALEQRRADLVACLRTHLADEDARRRAAETPEQREIRELRAEVRELQKSSQNLASNPAPRSEPVAPMPFLPVHNVMTPPPSFGSLGSGPPPRVPTAMRGGAARVIGRKHDAAGDGPATRAMPSTSSNFSGVSTPAEVAAAFAATVGGKPRRGDG